MSTNVRIFITVVKTIIDTYIFLYFLGDQVNKLLNEFWREIVADVGPSICSSLSTAVVKNLGILLGQVSFDEMMPE